MNEYLIAGNWKMNTGINEAIDLAGEINKLNKANPNVNVAVIPPFTHLSTLISKLGNSKINVGAQDCFYEESGAFTGEISALALKEIGCEYVLAGHSERRTIFGETDEVVNKKVKAIFKNKMTPILCIGETLEEREKGLTENVLERQMIKAFMDLSEDELDRLVIAYEPVWAIGTGVSATKNQADETHNFIRDFITIRHGEIMKNNYLLYGGSMKPSNAEQLLSLDNVNGGLIGGASLKAIDFTEIINIANSL